MKRFIPILIILSVFLITSCLPQAASAFPEKPAGFLMGIWHGWMAPLSLIISLFNDNVRIYDTYNTGWWYDAGFYIAIISGFGGISLTRRKKHTDD